MKRKWPINRYHENCEQNPVACFQVTRRIHFTGQPTYNKSTIFLSKANNTLGYLEFRSVNFTFWDEYIAVWKIKQINTPIK
jgi:hypothetical protein